MYAVLELFCKMRFTRRKKTLFAFCWNTGLSLLCLWFLLVSHICFRVNPTATLDEKRETPVEIALSRNSTQVLDVLSEYTDISVTVKLVQLSKLMYSSDDVEKSKEEFQSLLPSLPLDLVSSHHSNFIQFLHFSRFKTAHNTSICR